MTKVLAKIHVVTESFPAKCKVLFYMCNHLVPDWINLAFAPFTEHRAWAIATKANGKWLFVLVAELTREKTIPHSERWPALLSDIAARC